MFLLLMHVCLVVLNPFHTSNIVEATLSNATKSNVASTKSNVPSTLLPKNGYNVEATGNKVASCFDSVAATLLLV